MPEQPGQHINNQLLEISKVLARVEQNVISLSSGQGRVEAELDSLANSLANVNQRLTILETLDIKALRLQHQAELDAIKAKCQELENKVSKLESSHTTWQQWASWIFNGCQSAAIAYLTYKMGLNP